MRKELVRLDANVDETNKRINTLTLEIQRQFAEVHRRIDAIQTTLLEIQKLLMELVMKIS